MYPAQGLADGDYSASDLPDDVTVDGASFSRSGTTYGNTTNGVIFEEDVWAKYRNGARSTRQCLIQGGVVDQFADTYTITTTFGFPPIAVERVSLCRWEAEYIDEGFDPPRLQIAYLEIQFADVSDFFGWYVSYGGEDGYAEPVTREPALLGRLNTPIGDYGNARNLPPRSIDFTVS
jgi:hypothetical protein